MELIEIQAFVTVAETRNFTRAAEQLHVSQPAISRRIDLLEHELEVALFERLRTGARLTDAGKAFLPFARQVLAGLSDGIAAVSTVREGNQGEFTLALVGTLASTALIGRLAGFRNENPDVRLTLRTARSDEVGTLVQMGVATLGLRYFADGSPGLHSEEIASEALVVVCAGASRLVSGVPASADSLRGVPWVTYPVDGHASGEPFAHALDRLLMTAGLGESERIVIDSLTAQKRMVEADFGLGLMPESAVSEEVRLGSLRVVPVAELASAVPIHLVYRVGGYLSAASSRLMAALR